MINYVTSKWKGIGNTKKEMAILSDFKRPFETIF